MLLKTLHVPDGTNLLTPVLGDSVRQLAVISVHLGSGGSEPSGAVGKVFSMVG